MRGRGLVLFMLCLKSVQPCFQGPYDFHVTLMLLLEPDDTPVKQLFCFQDSRIVLPLPFKVFKKEEMTAFSDDPLYEALYALSLIHI